jgi:hypothetical protein
MSGFERTEPRYSPWVAAIDPALRAIDGTAPEHDAVVNALVEWVYTELDLEYDTQWGASYYTEYRQNDWERGHFQFEAFLERSYGSVVNCSDSASILSAYANMVGAHLNYVILLEDFALNFIQAIGGDSFTQCPFGPWGCGFSYHAMTTDDGGETIWDATLALDGDELPGSTPNTAMLVRAVPGAEYLWRLSPDSAEYDHEAQVTIE